MRFTFSLIFHFCLFDLHIWSLGIPLTRFTAVWFWCQEAWFRPKLLTEAKKKITNSKQDETPICAIHLFLSLFLHFSFQAISWVNFPLAQILHLNIFSLKPLFPDSLLFSLNGCIIRTIIIVITISIILLTIILILIFRSKKLLKGYITGCTSESRSTAIFPHRAPFLICALNTHR